MKRCPHPPPEPAAIKRFVNAVIALSDNPGRPHVLRYLAASRELEDSRLALKARVRRSA
jgi:hypothetical protein